MGADEIKSEPLAVLLLSTDPQRARVAASRATEAFGRAIADVLDERALEIGIVRTDVDLENLTVVIVLAKR